MSNASDHPKEPIHYEGETWGLNPMLENLLTDAEGIGLVEAAGEYAQEIAGCFANDPVADFGPVVVEQVHRLIKLILD